MTPQPRASVKNLEELLHRMTDRIRRSLELPEILDATVDEMRRFLKTDRVKIYQFHPDDSGEVVAEAIYQQRLPSLLGQHFPAEDIPEQARELLLKLRQRSIVNVSTQEIGLSPLLPEALKTTLQKQRSTPISFRSVDPCHVEYLTAMGVQSSLVVPILHRHQLWGLLVAHHSMPRRFGHKELEIVQLIADQVAIAISHANLLQLTRLQGQRESIINQTVSYLHSTVEDPLQRALQHMVNALQCAGGRLYIESENRCLSVGTQLAQLQSDRSRPVQFQTIQQQPTPPQNNQQLERSNKWLAWLRGRAANQVVTNLWAISDTNAGQSPRAIANLLSQANIRSLVIVKLMHQNQFLGYLSLFRQPIDIEIVWAKRLDDSDPRQQRPRQSFEAWQEIKRNQAHPWEPGEIGLIQDLADRFSSVVYQTQLYRRIRALNADLEQRVSQRTAELQETNQHLVQEIAERERTLSELQEARDSLKRLSHQNELILEAAGEGIYGIDPDGRVVFSNPTAAKIIGHPSNVLTGQNVFTGQFMHDLLKHANPEGDRYPWQESPIFNTLCHGQTHHVAGDLFERQDGSKFPVEYVSTSIQEDGRIVGAVVVFQDITERQAVDSMKNEFVAVVSHELRTPLTSIRAALGLLAQNQIEIPAAKQQRMIEIASSNTNRLVRLVSDILDVERIKLGKVVLNKQTCDLPTIMAQAVDEMRAMAENRNVHLLVSPLSIRLRIDPDKIIQTIANLLSNAIKFSPINSTVEISAQHIQANETNRIQNRIDGSLSKVDGSLSKEGKLAIRAGLETHSSLLLIQIKDAGRGIPEDQLETIFDQFKQLNTSDQEHQGGTGLGLTICRSIVQQHGGEIWAQSKLGSGSTFCFMLPIDDHLSS